MHKIATFILPLTLLAGCASQPEAQRPTPPASPPKAAPVVRAPQPAVKPKAEPSYQAQGKASYYAARHHGRRTASGERLNNNALTAAHRELPFGTQVKVTNLSNNKSVVVRINDRGPHTRGRLIDLSRQAAEQLGMLRSGTAKVRVQGMND